MHLCSSLVRVLSFRKIRVSYRLSQTPDMRIHGPHIPGVIHPPDTVQNLFPGQDHIVFFFRRLHLLLVHPHLMGMWIQGNRSAAQSPSLPGILQSKIITGPPNLFQNNPAHPPPLKTVCNVYPSLSRYSFKIRLIFSSSSAIKTFICFLSPIFRYKFQTL